MTTLEDWELINSISDKICSSFPSKFPFSDLIEATQFDLQSLSALKSCARQADGERLKLNMFHWQSPPTRISLSSQLFENTFSASDKKLSFGYFCFLHQLDKFYENDKTFSCRYVPPELKAVSDVSTDALKELSVWDETIKMVTVEAVCLHKEVPTPDSLLTDSEKVKIDEVDQQTENKLKDLEQKFKQEQLVNQKLENELIQEKKDEQLRESQLEEKLSLELKNEMKDYYNEMQKK